MSENEIEKRTKEVLGESKSSMAKAIVLMSISMDKMTAAIVENQKKVDEKIIALELKTDKRFEELRFWRFLSQYGWVASMLLISLIIIIIWSVNSGDPGAAVKLIK